MGLSSSSSDFDQSSKRIFDAGVPIQHQHWIDGMDRLRTYRDSGSCMRVEVVANRDVRDELTVAYERAGVSQRRSTLEHGFEKI